MNFIKTVDAGTWTGMQASGTLTTPSGDTEIQSPATLTVRNGDSFRLDVNMPQGQRSIRIQGSYGQIQESNGFTHSLPLATAMNGLLAFPKLLVSTFPGQQSSIIDQGAAAVGGKTLHRITVEEPVFSNYASTDQNWISIVDLYFDPTTELLIKSVGSVQLDSADPERYIQAITYGDYRKIGDVLLPFAYSQTLNGQPQWSLQLTDIQMGTSSSASYFAF